MRAVVFAYHNMGVLGIDRLLSHGFEIPLVFTHEDSVGENIWFGSVAEMCKNKGLEYVTPENPNTGEWIERLRAIEPDIIFSFYYRLMIGRDILNIPPLGTHNLHGSLLPAYRGRCPVNWVIIKGEKTTGVTLHEMVDKPDAGDIVIQKQIQIADDDTALSLFGKLEEAAGLMLDEILPHIAQGRFPKTPQDLTKGSYFGGRRPEDGRISWSMSAVEICNLIRGVTRPYPGAFAFLYGEQITFWRAVCREDIALHEGEITFRNGEILIGTGKGVLAPLDIEKDGKVFKGSEIIGYFKSHHGEYME